MMRDHAPDEGDIRIVGHDAVHHRSVHFIHRLDVGPGEIRKAFVSRGRPGVWRAHHPLHYPTLHHLAHRAHAFRGHGLHHGPALLGHHPLHAGHLARGRRRRGSLLHLRGRGPRVVGVMPGLREGSAWRARQQADSKGDCDCCSVHWISSSGSGALARVPGRGSPFCSLVFRVCAGAAGDISRSRGDPCASRSDETWRLQDAFR